MNTTTNEIDLTHFDVRSIPCRVKHAQIIQRWKELPVGAHFVLVNDHDPVPLYYQFATIFPGEFTWEHLVAGPEVFQVKISRVAAGKQGAVTPPPVSGGCGNHAQDLARSAHAAVDTTVVNGEIDARGLEPPHPMLVILTAVEELKCGGTLKARTDRKPLHLYPELETRGVRYQSEQQSDGSWVTTLRRG
ncbi:hypothetical protein CMV30_05970 [Nibricoccus aquaticus]|uniref:DUF2249 domain-containing protein n=1 Tax=Nibricoccus aquaticus TaxID=2576891 RepID=A0A290Q5I1_9BACT|nr:DUF2249 domain-containing protein [Nibricoccus aquaticus]ATC63537.1 hypothetical protein CMV30_05970 [Nibricoccus aquaticus]